jgi:hypothetical protein
MKKAVFCTLVGLFIAVPSAYADESSKAFYSKCIEAEIQHCQVKAERVNSRSARIREDAEKARKQAEYLEVNRDALIQQMEQQRVNTKNHKVRRYLLDAYYETRLARE